MKSHVIRDSTSPACVSLACTKSEVLRTPWCPLRTPPKLWAPPPGAGSSQPIYIYIYIYIYIVQYQYTTYNTNL